MLIEITNSQGQKKTIDDSQLADYGLSIEDVNKFQVGQSGADPRQSTPTDRTSYQKAGALLSGQQPTQEPPLGGLFTSGVPKFATKALPYLGLLAPELAGTLLGGPVGAAASIPLAAAGAAGGEALKEYLQGEKLSPSAITTQGVIGGAAGPVGKIGGKFIVGGAKMIPGVGPLVEGITGLSDRAIAKWFGEGSQNFVKEYGLNKSASVSPTKVAGQVQEVQRAIGGQIDQLLTEATNQGRTVTVGDLNQVIKDAEPSVGPIKNIFQRARKTVFVRDEPPYVAEIRRAIGTAVDKYFGTQQLAAPISDGTPVPLQLVNDLKQSLAARVPTKAWGGQSVPEKQIYKNMAGGLRQLLEDTTKGIKVGGKELGQINSDYNAGREVLGHLKYRVSPSVEGTGGGGGSLFRPWAFGQTLAPQKAIGQFAGTQIPQRELGYIAGGKYIPQLAGEGESAKLQEVGTHAAADMTIQKRQAQAELNQIFPAPAQLNPEQPNNIVNINGVPTVIDRQWLANKAQGATSKDYSVYQNFYNEMNKAPTTSPQEKTASQARSVYGLAIDLYYSDPKSQEFKTKISMFKPLVDNLVKQKSSGAGGSYGAILNLFSQKGIDYPSTSDSQSVAQQKLKYITDVLNQLFIIPDQQSTASNLIPADQTTVPATP